jgi:hypothetical protein
MSRPRIAAGILAYRESALMIAAAAESACALDGVFVFGEDERIDTELDEARVRQKGLELAKLGGADWYLQIDADERLVDAPALFDYLEWWPHRAWPLPYVQENGTTTLAPCKCIRLAGARCVLASDVYEWELGPAVEGPYVLSGYTVPAELEPLIGRLPRLMHEPSRRPHASSRRRLSVAIEGTHSRAGLVQWPLPSPPFPRARALAG